MSQGQGYWLVRVALSASLVWLCTLLKRYIEIESFKKRHQCQSPPSFGHSDRVWGSDLVQERMQAMKEGKYFRLYLKHFQVYGKTFEDKIRGHKTINSMEPRNAQQVLALATGDYIKDSARVKAQAPFLGRSVFSDGPQWKHSRDMVKPIFDRAELSDMEQLSVFVDRFLHFIPEDGTMIDMQPLLHRLFVDVSTDFIFGEPVGCLLPEIPTSTQEFLAAFIQAQRWVTKRREAGWMSFRLNYSRDWIKSYTTVHRFVDYYAECALQNTQPETADSTQRAQSDSTKLHKRYVLVDELAKQENDRVALRYQVLGVLLPAQDTAALAVSNCLFQLARHPHEWTKLRQIALSRAQEPLNFEKLKALVEFRYVIFETIRTIGPVARVVREALRDTTLPVGGGSDGKAACFVPKGTTVSISTWCMCHDADTWGDDVEEFRPERWAGRKTYWDFIPFSGGPRICPAQQQVLTHVTYLLVKLTQKFETIANCDPVEEYIEHFKMVPTSKNGVKVGFRKVSSKSMTNLRLASSLT